MTAAAPIDPIESATGQSTPTRRCWRCLQTFACTEDDVPPGHAEWWLCEACHTSLIGPIQASRR